MDYQKTRLWWVAFILAGLGVIGFASPLFAKGPMAVVEQAEFKAGPVKQGKAVKHGFTVFNQGDEPLQIFKVKPS